MIVKTLLLALMLCAYVVSLDCVTGQTHITVVRKCGSSWASEEKYTISDGGTTLIEKNDFVNDEDRTTEFCVASSSNDLYTLVLTDTYGDSWSSGAWIAIQGLYGNIVFKHYLVADTSETYTISLNTPVKKNASWKYSASATGTWTDINYGDSSWTVITTGTTTQTATGTQYFRISFNGLANMAAYEVHFNYRYGIVAYLNAGEIFRENMPEGVPSQATVSQGDHGTYEYRGIIRSAYPIVVSTNVIAVEMHFPLSHSETIQFNGWFALYAPTSLTTPCYYIGNTVTSTSTSGTNPSYATDYFKYNYWSVTSMSTNPVLSMTVSGSSPAVNGIEIFPYTLTNNIPRKFSFDGGVTTSAYTTLFARDGIIHTSKVPYITFSGFQTTLYKNYRIIVQQTGSTYCYIPELRLAVCNVAPPTSMVYNPISYTLVKGVDDVIIAPSNGDFGGCTISPLPPAGMSFNSDICTLSGIPSAASTTTTYTVTSSASLSGTFSLTVNDCTGNVIEVSRVYGASYYAAETFSIIDDASQAVLYAEAASTTQAASSTVNRRFCVTGSRYKVTVGSSNTFYYMESYVHVYGIVAGEREPIMRMRFDNYLGLPTYRFFSTNYPVKAMESWYYRMDNTDANWYNSDTTGWSQGSRGSFTAGTTRFQTFKKTFQITSLTNAPAFTISLRYKYACIIYINSVEVFRNAITGDLSSTSTAESAYTDVKYHQITLPTKTMASGTTPSTSLVTTGSNTIAIALVAIANTQTTVDFDCAIRLFGDTKVSRLMEYTATISGSSSIATNAFDDFYSNYLYYSACGDNYVDIIFNDDRRDWISSFSITNYFNEIMELPGQVTLQARNSDSETWTTLSTITGMRWWVKASEKIIYVINNKPYNKFRFANIGTGDASSCATIVNRLALYIDNMDVSIPALSYETQNAYLNIEMAEIYPNSVYYSEFSVNPSLPAGLFLDPPTGTFLGTPTALTPQATYTITAHKMTGESVTATLTLGVIVCSGTVNLITYAISVDSYPGESSWKLYQGRTTTGNPMRSGSPASSNTMYYADFCIPSDIYSIVSSDSWGDGWYHPAGYRLSVDQGELIFEVGQVPSGTSPVQVTTVFSSFIPFQIEFSSWKYSSGEAPDTWAQLNFDDSAWSSGPASSITYGTVVAYVRYTFNLPNVNDYKIMNVRVKYNGGVAAYLNGHRVARFNLPNTITTTTYANSEHTGFSKFHAILLTNGATAGNNVMAFELHRANGQSTANPEFDATATFNVNDCSYGIDSYVTSSIVGSTPTVGVLANLFDGTPFTYMYFENVANQYVEWSVENLDGSRFNNFGFLGGSSITGLGFSLYGRFDPADDWLEIIGVTGVTTKDREITHVDTPIGLAAFPYFKYEVDVAGSYLVMMDMFMGRYCSTSSTSVCETDGVYPTVADGQKAPASCAYGYQGYSYRLCTGTTFGEIKNENCKYRVPENMAYSKSMYNLVLNIPVVIAAPTYDYIITEFYLASDQILPSGLTLDTATGSISGTPDVIADASTYKIYGKNDRGAAFVEISIIVKKGNCNAEGVFPKTEVGKTAVYDCSAQSGYIGSQSRVCKLGKTDGEWEKASGFCVSVVSIILIVVVVIVIVVVAVFLLLRTGRKTKAVGGVKGKKSSPASKKSSPASKKASTKNVVV